MRSSATVGLGLLLLLTTACERGGHGSAQPEDRAPGLYTLELSTKEVAPLPGIPASLEAAGAAVSPDGSRVAFDGTVEGSRQIFVIDAPDGEPVQVTNDYEASVPTWSPDGGALAYVGFGSGTGRAIVILDLATGKTRRLTRGTVPVWGPDWSPDGRTIVFQVEQEDGWDLRAVDVGTGDVTTLCCPEPSIASDADWSPDGDRLVYGYATAEDLFALFTMAPTGERIAPVEPGDPTRYHGHPVWSPDGTKIAYQGAPGIWVLDLASGEDQMLDPLAWSPAWLDEDTLIVEVPTPSG